MTSYGQQARPPGAQAGTLLQEQAGLLHFLAVETELVQWLRGLCGHLRWGVQSRGRASPGARTRPWRVAEMEPEWVWVGAQSSARRPPTEGRLGGPLGPDGGRSEESLREAGRAGGKQ